MQVTQLIFLLLCFLVLISPLALYFKKLINNEKTLFHKSFSKIETFLAFCIGVKLNEEMSIKQILTAFLWTNLWMILFVFVILKINHMDWSLAFNTAVSFGTNTDLQNYNPENYSTLSIRLSLIFLMFTSSSTGITVAFIFIRGLTKRPLGNYYKDFIQIIVRILLPLSLIFSILLMFFGTPETFKREMSIQTLEGATQIIPLGPVAAWESIKHLGTNGGGIFSANSAHPFSNPNAETNFLEILAMMLIPGALIIAFGLVFKSKKQGFILFIVPFFLFLLSLFCTIYFENKASLSNFGIHGLNLEGKELRTLPLGAAVFSTVTTTFTTGSVNNMHDSLSPMAGFFTLWGMILNCIFGGDGVGFMNLILFALLTVFLCGLMVGKTPEIFRKKLEPKEMRLIAFCILIHPIIILVPTAITLFIPHHLLGITNPSFHGFSQVLYQFTSSGANNGSGFEGLVDGSSYYNQMNAFVMLLGRYISMILLLLVSASLLNKQELNESLSSFRTDNFTFAIILFISIIVIGALTFFPALTLGPIAEYLSQMK